MKKICVSFVVLLLAGSLAFAGGGSQSQSGGGAAPAAGSGKILIGLAMPETHVERWQKDGATLKSLLEAKGYAAQVQYGNADQPTQNQQIQSFLTQGAKALVIGCVNDGVGSVVAEAARSNVKVLAYDRIIQGTSNYSCYITFNNYAVGTLMGQAIEKALNLPAATKAAPKYITYFAGSPTDANANFFFQGAVDVIQKYVDSGALVVIGPQVKSYKDVSLFQQIATENWSGPLAKQRMEGLLVGAAANVTLDAVLAPNDTLARAIIEALKADKKYQSKLPFVTGQDAEADSVLSIKNGEQGMTVFKDTSKLAEAAVTIIDALASGKALSPTLISGAYYIDPNNKSDSLIEIANTGAGYVPTYLLTPISIDKSNTNVPIDAGFYTPAEAAKLK